MTKYNVDTTGEDIVKDLGTHAAGKTILITGPSQNGIGAEIAKTIANAHPTQLFLAGRNKTKVDPVINEINKVNPMVEVTFIQCDLSDNASVRSAANQVASMTEKLDILINNAGIMAAREFQKSVDGLESQFAAGHLGHFLLTNLLMKELVAAKGVVINITSSAYVLDEPDVQDPNFHEGRDYNPWNAYGRVKTANVLFSVALADRYGSQGVTSFAVDPGMVTGTNLMANTGVDGGLMQKGMEMAVARNGGKPLPPHPKVNLQQGCASALLIALDDNFQEQSPAYVKECAITPTLPYATDKKTADALWKQSETLVGQTFGV